MTKTKYPGKLIVFEGIDGSGKATQAKFLKKFLKKKDIEVEKIDFPQYETKSAGMVENYLDGKYGSAKEVGAYRASIFFACDRYDASFKMKKWLKEGKVVIADRYLASNIAHQGGKIEDRKEREEYFKWLYNLEYNIFEIPRPDLTFILKTSVELAKKMAARVEDEEKRKKKTSFLKGKKQDIHESDLNHLANALKAYEHVAQIFPEEFRLIECLNNEGKWLKPKMINNKIIKEINKIL